MSRIASLGLGRSSEAVILGILDFGRGIPLFFRSGELDLDPSGDEMGVVCN